MKFLKIIQRCIFGCSKCRVEREGKFHQHLKSTIPDTYILVGSQKYGIIHRKWMRPVLTGSVILLKPAGCDCKLLSGRRRWQKDKFCRAVFSLKLQEHVMVPSAGGQEGEELQGGQANGQLLVGDRWSCRMET